MFVMCTSALSCADICQKDTMCLVGRDELFRQAALAMCALEDVLVTLLMCPGTALCVYVER